MRYVSRNGCIVASITGLLSLFHSLRHPFQWSEMILAFPKQSKGSQSNKIRLSAQCMPKWQLMPQDGAVDPFVRLVFVADRIA